SQITIDVARAWRAIAAELVDEFGELESLVRCIGRIQRVLKIGRKERVVGAEDAGGIGTRDHVGGIPGPGGKSLRSRSLDIEIGVVVQVVTETAKHGAVAELGDGGA